ncbi:MAG: hypothetical protein V3G42_00955 [Oscillospiraceae bacterium]
MKKLRIMVDTNILISHTVLIKGDKDFADLDVEKPEILTPSAFMEKYIK